MPRSPVEWYWRPARWPVTNHVIDRPLRIWSIDGPDTIALDALERGDAEPLRRRSAHHGSGLYPENHLWDAIHGYLDLLTASRRFLNDTG